MNVSGALAREWRRAAIVGRRRWLAAAWRAMDSTSMATVAGDVTTSAIAFHRRARAERRRRRWQRRHQRRGQHHVTKADRRRGVDRRGRLRRRRRRLCGAWITCATIRIAPGSPRRPSGDVMRTDSAGCWAPGRRLLTARRASTASDPAAASSAAARPARAVDRRARPEGSAHAYTGAGSSSSTK